MQEVIERIDTVETNITKKLDDFYESFSKHETLEMALFDQNQKRIDRLEKTTTSMQEEYRSKFIKLEKSITIVGVALFIAYAIALIIKLF
jgi:ribosome biogenesis GTPase A